MARSSSIDIVSYQNYSGGWFGKQSHLTTFTVLPADMSLRLIVDSDLVHTKSVDEIKLAKLLNTDGLMSYLQDMHKYISSRRTKARKTAIRRHN